MKDLSVIIPSYNTCDITQHCICAVVAACEKSKLSYEIVIIDNGSTDGSVLMLQQINTPFIKKIFNSTNYGYGKANNQGLDIAVADFILFLNSDVFIDIDLDFADLITYMKLHDTVGALTVRVELSDGSIDPASHRGFPTLWRSFCYFLGLERSFSRFPLFNRIFGGYHLKHMDINSVHEIDSPTGAFYLTRRSIMKKVRGFDTDFFMYGEDLDLSYRIKKLGYKIIYYPLYRVLHAKYQSGLRSIHNRKRQIQTRKYFYNAMSMFYKKHYKDQYPGFVNWFVYFMINFMDKFK